jgi:hypothetical protein
VHSDCHPPRRAANQLSKERVALCEHSHKCHSIVPPGLDTQLRRGTVISVHRGASRTDRESQALLGLSTHTSFLVVDSAHVRPLGSEGIHSTPKATEMQRIERTIIYGNIDTIWHRHPCLLDVFERAFVFGHRASRRLPCGRIVSPTITAREPER